MARKSTGTIPPRQPLIDANQAVALLDTLHFWRATKVNDTGGHGYSVTVVEGGRRVSAYGKTLNGAAWAAMEKLRGNAKPVPYMRLAE